MSLRPRHLLRLCAAALTLLGVATPGSAAQRLAAKPSPLLDQPVAASLSPHRVKASFRQAMPAREPGAGKVILQLAAGVAGAWLGGLAGYQLVAGIADDRTVKGDAGYSPAGNGGFVAGSALGSATASALVGWALRTDGSYPGALVGASVPSLLLLLGLDEPYLGLIGAIFVAPLQSGGAYLGWRSLF